MSNEQIKAAVAALVLGALNLFTVLGLHLSEQVTAWATTLVVLAAGYFAPRIQYLGHRYAGSIGAVAGAAAAGLNLLITNGLSLDDGVVAALTAVLAAVTALFSPSLTRAPTT